MDEIIKSANIELPDFDFETDTAEEVEDEESPETPESDDVSTDDEDSEDLEEDSEEDDDDTDDTEDGDDETGEDDEEDDDDSFLPKFDRKEIEKNPELNAVYKHMQRSYTKAMQKNAEVRKAAEASKGESDATKLELEEFVTTLKSDEGAEDFLLRMALGRPQLFQKVIERFQEFAEDDDALKQYIKEAQLADREKQVEKHEQMTASEKKTARGNQVTSVMLDTAKQLGLSEEMLTVAETYVVAKINENKARNGNAGISDEEVQHAVQEAAKALGVVKTKVKTSVDKANKLKGKDKARQLAKQANKPRPAAAKSSSIRKTPKPAPKGVDPLHHLIDGFLGLDR